MYKTKFLNLLLFLLAGTMLFAQTGKKNNKSVQYDSPVDFRVISSNSSYVEFEFTPKYTTSVEFLNAAHNSSLAGKPDLGSRNFPVITPGDINNRIEILDVKFEDLYNVDVKPVPTPKKGSNSLEVLYDYNYDEKTYSGNSLYPKVNAEFIQDGKFRNKYFGIAQIYPVQFNPLNKSVRRITYIRVRVAFGKSPVFSAKLQTKQELEFLRDISINWENAVNWVTPEFNSYKSTIQNSVLATGDFFKIEVKETGMYKIDKNFLNSAGINTANIDPRTIKIYGNGGKELPYLNSAPAPEDLLQNPIYVSGESDGVFNDNDYVLFYGLSPHQWIQQGNTFMHKLNTYSNVNYYWITFGGSNGMRMQEIQSTSIPNLNPVDRFVDKLFEEPEINNLGATGNLWVSQRIGYGESFSFNKQLTGYIPGTDVKCNLVLGNGTTTYDAYYSVTDNNSGFSGAYSVYAVNGVFSHISLSVPPISFQYPLASGNTMNLKATLTQAYNVPSVSGYYDYLEAFYSRGLNSAENNLLKITSSDSTGTMEYQASTFSSSTVKVFKVSTQTDIQIINPISYTNGTVRFQDNSTLLAKKDFYVVGDNSYKTPSSITSKVPNQNLRGISDGADFIIYTTSDFLSAANRLKTQREAPGEGSPNYLKTLVVDINQVYNEFSGGLVDPVAMRSFLKYAYNNWSRRPVYVLFLGDGSFDYKNIYNAGTKNYVPPIERTDPTMNEIASYNSDDFITEINEDYQTPEAVRTDFSSGRFCINSLRDANLIIDKILQYESNQNIGIWKKKIMYCADDGWTTENNQGEEGDLHTRQCETIAEVYTSKDFEKEKIYIVSYPAIITPQGRRKPGANVDIIKGWNEGRLLINWTGHGSTDLWAHEHVFVKDESIPLMTNKNKYPIVTIASCDLARWDDPFIVSAAEQLIFVPEAGAIAVIAATRPVYANYNEIFNNALWNNIMFYKDTLNLPIRIGKAMYNVKNQLASIGENDMKFCLIGDPTLRVGIPQYFTRIDSINAKSVYDTAIVKSLQKMRISGSVLKTDSTFWNNFNGDIDIKVLDVDKNITIVDFGRTFNYRLDGGVIFKGSAKVKNGLWSIEFIVPKDISYSSGNGKILAYFNNTSYEGSGYTDRFILSGIDTTAVSDTLGPDISLYMDNRTFRSGDVVNQNAKLIADLYDFSGINLTGTIGHKIEAVLNNNDNNKLDLTPYYNTTNGYQFGTVEYSFNGLPDGDYTLKFKAWDTYNNFKETSVNFVVKSTSSLVVSNLFNYPNPMKDNTSFTFQHNFDTPLSADILIYSVAGRKIQTIKRTNITEKNVSIEWDGKDADGDYIANGTYIYKVIVKTEDGSFSNVQTGKLARLK
ncbi:MAG: type IX secretion system sortase PorU [Ignavibacteriae bacterium]|nr:type IX secretion system sortase PorU [Ignavibacteriota bacterium]